MIHKAIKASVIAMSVLFSACTFTGCINDAVSKPENSAQNEYYDMEFHRGGRDARPEHIVVEEIKTENGNGAKE